LVDLKESVVSEHYDELERRNAAEREEALFARLPGVIEAALVAPGWKAHLGTLEPASINSRAVIATLPVLRKSELPALQKLALPFGGFVPGPIGAFGRLFTSPGPIFEPEGTGPDPWHAVRAFFAAGFRPSDIVLNTLSYHLTPGGFIADSGARALGCPVIPAGPGNTEQ
jgi:phenylacetate-CoA ligase